MIPALSTLARLLPGALRPATTRLSSLLTRSASELEWAQTLSRVERMATPGSDRMEMFESFVLDHQLVAARDKRFTARIRRFFANWSDAAQGLLMLHDMRQRIQRGGNYQLSTQEDTVTSPALPMTPELLQIKETVARALQPLLAEEVSPRLLLLGPGHSKTDPLYAKYLLDQLNRQGELIVYERETSELMDAYYSRIALDPHHASLYFGAEGDYTNVTDLNAHLIIALHPARNHQDIHRVIDAIERNLSPGGLIILQVDSGVNEELAREKSANIAMLMEMIGCERLYLFSNPVFATHFSQIYPETAQTFVYQRRP